MPVETAALPGKQPPTAEVRPKLPQLDQGDAGGLTAQT